MGSIHKEGSSGFELLASTHKSLGMLPQVYEFRNNKNKRKLTP